MSQIKFFLACLLVVTLNIACDKDDGPTTINYDGANVTAPVLAPGEHEAAAFFPASIMQNHTGKVVSEITYYMNLPPDVTKLKIYRNGPGNLPGDVIYEVNENNVTEADWNSHKPARDIEIDGQGIWVSVAMTTSISSQYIGCDAEGNGQENGDWLFLSTDNQWIEYHDREPVDINWNIRLKVE